MKRLRRLGPLNWFPSLQLQIGHRGDFLDVAAKQGDQIGRIFAQWAIVCFGQFLKNDRYSPQI
jgi:hypothetical protein